MSWREDARARRVKEEVARHLLAQGRGVRAVAVATGLSLPQLARLQAEAPDYMSPGEAA